MRWTKQPPPRTRIDRNNPLTNGLVAAWIGTDKNNAISTGYPFAAAAGSVDRPSVIFNDAYERVNSNGITGWRPADPDRVGGDDFIDVNFSSSFTSGSADWTLFSVNQFYNSNHDHALWGLDASGNFQIWADTNGGALRLGIYDGASATYAAESSLNDNTRPYCIGVSFNSAADDCNGYIDGTLAVSDTGFSGSAAGNLQINASTTTKIGYQGIFLWAIWDRELSPSEHKQLAENPWQIYSTRRFALADPLPDTRVLEVPTKEWTKQPPAGTKLDLSNSIVKKAAFLWSGSNSGGAYGIDHISGVQGVQSTWSTNNVNFNNTEKGSAINSLYNATDAYNNQRYISWFSILTSIELKLAHKLQDKSLKKLNTCKSIINKRLSLWKYDKSFHDSQNNRAYNQRLINSIIPIISKYQTYIYECLDVLGYENPVKENYNGLFD